MKWTPEMIAYLREVAPGSTVAEIREMMWHRFGVLFTKSAVSNAKHVFGVNSGVNAGCFERGHVPANKGKRQEEYMSPEALERSKATRFRKGHEPQQGAQIPVGAERVGKDGYIEVKVSRFSGQPGAHRCWKSKARVVWEEAHGPVPRGHIVIFIDGDKRNFDLDNLACVSQADMVQIHRRGLAYHDRETLQIALDIVHLDRAVHRSRCKERPCRRCGRTFKPRYPHQRSCDECLGRKDK